MAGICLGGVLGCLSDSGYSLVWGGGEGVEGIMQNHLIKIQLKKCHQQVPSLPGASECLKVVWKVSERCLGVV